MQSNRANARDLLGHVLSIHSGMLYFSSAGWRFGTARYTPVAGTATLKIITGATHAEFVLAQHKCRLLLMGSNCAVWRVYLNVPTDYLEIEFLQKLDAQLAHGFQQRAVQLDKIQQILQQERREFFAELHDSITQIIGFLRLKSAKLNQQYAPLLEQTAEIASYTHYAYQQVRELITASRLTYQELDFSTALKKSSLSSSINPALHLDWIIVLLN